MGNIRYNLSDSDPELKLQVRYSNCVTEEINITEDMYVVDDTHSIPDFKKAGEAIPPPRFQFWRIVP